MRIFRQQARIDLAGARPADKGVVLHAQGQPMVIRQGHAALQLACRARAAIIEAQRQAEWQALLPLNLQVALARLRIAALGRHDLDIGFGRRNALEVLQRLLRIAHVEQVARPRRYGVPPGATGIGAGSKADLADAPRYHAQGQGATAQVLRFGQHARGDVAARDDGVLHAAHQHIDGLRAQAAPQRRVRRAQVISAGALQCPLELRGILAAQHKLVNRKTRCFACRQAVGGHGGRRLNQAHVGIAFLLLAQEALALLLAYQFLAGIVALAGARRVGKERRDFRTGLRGHGSTQGAAKQKYTAPWRQAQVHMLL